MSERDQMSDRRENSVLVALKELRGIEDDRVKREQDDARARVEAERLAKEVAEKRLREEEESRRSAEEDRLRRIEEEKAAKIREEHLRVEDADRRARVDGEMKLREQKMRLEIQSRVGKSPLKAIAAVALVLALVGGVIVYKIQAANRQEIAEAQKKAEQDRTAARAAQAELEKRITAITKDMDDRLKAAKTDAERAQIRAEALQRRNEVAEERQAKVRSKTRGGSASTPEAPKTGARIPGKRDINDNILDGL